MSFGMKGLFKVMVASCDMCWCVCVNGSALVLCGRDMWFVGGRNMCDIFCVQVELKMEVNKECI
jgi:hypothetical protein